MKVLLVSGKLTLLNKYGERRPNPMYPACGPLAHRVEQRTFNP